MKKSFMAMYGMHVYITTTALLKTEDKWTLLRTPEYLSDRRYIYTKKWILTLKKHVSIP
jgi:hypothetical protein